MDTPLTETKTNKPHILPCFLKARRKSTTSPLDCLAYCVGVVFAFLPLPAAPTALLAAGLFTISSQEHKFGAKINRICNIQTKLRWLNSSELSVKKKKSTELSKFICLLTCNNSIVPQKSNADKQ